MVDIVRELGRQYTGCYGKLEDRPIRITSIDRGDKGPIAYISYLQSTGRIVNGPTVSFSDLDLSFPRLGCINGNGLVCYTYRKARRQWRRALYLDVLGTKVIQESIAITAGIELNRGKLLYNALTANYPAAEEAYKEVEAMDVISMAFSPELYFSNHMYYETPVLGYKTWTVGVATKGGVELLEGCEHLKELVSKYTKVIE